MYFVKVLVLISACRVAISTEPQYEYHYIEKFGTYEQAMLQCRTHDPPEGGWVLAMPKTLPEATAVKKYLSEAADKKRVWIGLNDKQKEGEFRWQDGTDFIAYFAWNSEQPSDSGNEDCVEIVSGTEWGMNDRQCGSSIAGLVCQKEVVPPPLTTTTKRVKRTTTEPPSNTSTIVVIIVATLLLLGLAVGCMVYYMKSSKTKRHSEGDSEGDAEDGASVNNMGSSMGSSAASASRASTSSRGSSRSSMAAGSSRASSRGMRSSSSFGNSRKSSSMGGSSRGGRASSSSRKSKASVGSLGRKP